MTGTSKAVALERRARVEQMSLSGMTVEQIARDVGVTTSTVVRIRQEAGVSRWARRMFTDGELSRCLSLLEDGASYNEVARTIGRSVGVVARRFPGFGWTAEEQRDFSRARRLAVSTMGGYMWGAK